MKAFVLLFGVALFGCRHSLPIRRQETIKKVSSALFANDTGKLFQQMDTALVFQTQTAEQLSYYANEFSKYAGKTSMPLIDTMTVGRYFSPYNRLYKLLYYPKETSQGIPDSIELHLVFSNYGQNDKVNSIRIHFFFPKNDKK